MKKFLVMAVLLAGISGVTGQIKLGKVKIDTQKMVRAASDVAGAVTLSDADIAAMSKEYMQWMDTHNPLASQDSELGKRLAELTQNVKVDGLTLNFKVYEVVDVNAFACGDGSVRVCAGLMEIMDDDELMSVIGHEIGHVVNKDTRDAMKNAYMRSAAKNAAGAMNETVAKLSDSELGALAESLANAQYSQKQESAADDFGFEFCIKNNIDPYASSKALTKLVELENGNAKSSKVQKMFSSHPDSEKRAARMKEKADELKK